MSPLFKRKQVSREQIIKSMTDEHPIAHPLPLPEVDPNRSMGHGFNIVKMIEEHAPVRIKAIDEELDAMNRKHAELSWERLQLTKLLTAIQN